MSRDANSGSGDPGQDVISIGNALRKVRSTMGNLERTQGTVRDLTAIWTQLQKQMDGSRAFHQQLQTLLEKELSQTVERNAGLQGPIKDQMNGLHRLLNENDSFLRIVLQTVRSIEPELVLAQQAQRQIRSVETERDGLRADVQRLNGELQDVQRRAQSREQEITSLQADAHTLRQQATQLSSTNQVQSGQLQILRGEKAVLENRVTALGQEKAGVQTQLTQAQGEIKNLREETDKHRNRITELTRQADELQALVLPLKAEVIMFRRDVPALKSQLREAQNIIQSRGKEIASLREELRRDDADLRTSRTRERDLQNQLGANTVQAWGYRTQVEERNTTVRTLEQEIITLRRRNSSNFWFWMLLFIVLFIGLLLFKF